MVRNGQAFSQDQGRGLFSDPVTGAFLGSVLVVVCILVESILSFCDGVSMLGGEDTAEFISFQFGEEEGPVRLEQRKTASPSRRT